MPELQWWFNGQWVPARKVLLPATDIGLQRGYGAYETIKSVQGQIYRLQDHIERLNTTLEALRLTPFPFPVVEKLCYSSLRRNKLTEAVIKIIVTGGQAIAGPLPKGKTTKIIMVEPFNGYPLKAYDKGISVITVELMRILPNIKTLNYATSVMAAFKARDANADEAILVDARDHVLEGATSNVFMVKDGILYTPRSGVLPGITRQRVLALAKKILPFREPEYIMMHEFQQADEIFITSSLRDIMPVTLWNMRRVGDGVPGQWTRRLLTALRQDMNIYASV